MSFQLPLISLKRLSRRHLLASAAAVVAALTSRSSHADTVFTADEYRLIPLRLHLLRAKEVASLHTKLTAEDARRILGKINRVWRPAGIQFYEESLRVEDAAAQSLYAGLGENRTEAHLRLVRPRNTLSDQTFHLYFLGEMGPNGICLDGSFQLLFVKQSAQLYPVPGGIDEHLPRVCAHEIGHALDLPHRQDTFNLMASGTSGTGLNEAEIGIARKAAAQWKWVLTPSLALATAERWETGEPTRAAALFTALAELPGGSVARRAKERLAALRPKPTTGG
jgi:hypothetical protein